MPKILDKKILYSNCYCTTSAKAMKICICFVIPARKLGRNNEDDVSSLHVHLSISSWPLNENHNFYDFFHVVRSLVGFHMVENCTKYAPKRRKIVKKGEKVDQHVTRTLFMASNKQNNAAIFGF